mmetsp:Transcript_90137/g.233805  ORF Transcript_90137/g.233805 Transcript_90137/m.233805 type:complete len:229 (-) Transcript_90137:174-860(-)
MYVHTEGIYKGINGNLPSITTIFCGPRSAAWPLQRQWQYEQPQQQQRQQRQPPPVAAAHCQCAVLEGASQSDLGGDVGGWPPGTGKTPLESVCHGQAVHPSCPRRRRRCCHPPAPAQNLESSWPLPEHQSLAPHHRRRLCTLHQEPLPSLAARRARPSAPPALLPRLLCHQPRAAGGGPQSERQEMPYCSPPPASRLPRKPIEPLPLLLLRAPWSAKTCPAHPAVPAC